MITLYTVYCRRICGAGIFCTLYIEDCGLWILYVQKSSIIKICGILGLLSSWCWCWWWWWSSFPLMKPDAIFYILYTTILYTDSNCTLYTHFTHLVWWLLLLLFIIRCTTTFSYIKKMFRGVVNKQNPGIETIYSVNPISIANTTVQCVQCTWINMHVLMPFYLFAYNFAYKKCRLYTVHMDVLVWDILGKRQSVSWKVLLEKIQIQIHICSVV